MNTPIGKDDSMDYMADIQKTIDYIELHIKGEITIGELAGQIGFSQKHYYRLFKSYVGIPVMDYVRRRKLAHAIFDLMNGVRVIDVALDYGFDTHNGFSKAFKRQYGSSPQTYILHAARMLPRPINLLHQTNKFNIYGGAIMEPKLVKKEAFKIAGYYIKTNGEKSTKDCPALWDKYNTEGWERKLYEQLKPPSHGEYGVCIENNMQTGEFIYLLGVAVNDFSSTDDAMYKAEIPAAQYAVFTTSPAPEAEFSKNIQSTWHYILEEWLPGSAYIWDETKPDFEFYDERCHADEEKVMDIYVPVLKKEAEI